MKEITVNISEAGDVEVSTKGFAGKACQDATRQLEAALGATTADTPTAEMMKRNTAHLRAGQ